MNNNNNNTSSSLVAYHGHLQTVPGKSHFIGRKSGEIVYPAGISLFWSSASAKFYNAEMVSNAKRQFNAGIIRIAMTAWSEWSDGYVQNPSKYIAHVLPVADACIKEGIYCIIDWHCEGDNSPYVAQAKTFFGEMAKRYAGVPNIIFEIWNEPKAQSWNQFIRPYCLQVIEEIRKHDKQVLILCGTETWSQKVEDAAKNPISDPNVGYVLHFYSNLHGPWLYQNKAKLGVPVFVTEWGTPGQHANTKGFLDWMEANKVPHCSWALNNKAEPLSYLQPGCTDIQGPWDEQKELTDTGRIFLDIIKNWGGNKVPNKPSVSPSPSIPSQPNSNTNSNSNFSLKFEAESYKSTSPGVEVKNKVVSFSRNRSWLVWEVDIPQDGNYVVRYHVSAQNGGSLRLDHSAGKVVLGNLNIPKNANWQTLEHNISIKKGKYRMGINALQGGWNLDWWSIQLQN